jgi:hypothetical protein
MPEIGGLNFEQKVVRVANNDLAINTEIATQEAGDWTVADLIVSGSDMVILFQRQTAVVEP